MLTIFGLLALISANVLADCPVYEYGVTDDQKNEIVYVHNRFRYDIANGLVQGQPQGSNLLEMFWDDSLAEAAQNIAYSCQFANQPVTDGRFQVGQNLYTFYSTYYVSGANWTSVVQAWFDENRNYSYSDDDYNHYTQVVWADTYLVGCGYTYFENDQGWYQKLYVCNYGPAGNVIGEYPYDVSRITN